MKNSALFKHNFLQLAIVLIAGAILPFAFAPYNLYLLAIICPAILFWTWLNASPKQAFFQGLFFGLSFFSVSVYWVYISIHFFGNASVAISLCITIGFILCLALFIAINGLLFRWLFQQTHFMVNILAFALSWVILEWLRGWLFTGFPWMFLGYSQINSPLAGIAPILSVYGVSFLVVLSSGLLVYSISNTNKRLPVVVLLAVIWLVCWGLTVINWTKPQGKPISVSLIQGNIPQSVKWNPNQITTTLTRYRNLTLQNIHQRIIIWPEAAIPIWYSQAQQFILPLAATLKKSGTALLTGIPVVNAAQTEIYNGAVVLGNGTGMYLKRHLVPFGEYVPLESLLHKVLQFFAVPMSNLSAGQMQQKPVNLAGLPTAVAICYEVAYVDEFLTAFPQAKLIVTISDDAWFGHSWASYQQTQISQMRSLETGRYQLVATNNGLTAIIDNKGNIIKQAPRFKIAALNGQIYNVSGNTPVSILGVMPIIILLLFAFIIVIFLGHKKSGQPHLNSLPNKSFSENIINTSH